MMHDPEFLAGQAYFGMPRGTNPDFDLFQLYHGGTEGAIRIGVLPPAVQRHLKWHARIIYLCPRNLYRHIRNHDKHPTEFDLVQWIPWLIEHGAIIRDKEDDIVFLAQVPAVSKSYLWLPVHVDKPQTGIWVKGFHLRRAASARSKIRRSMVLRDIK